MSRVIEQSEAGWGWSVYLLAFAPLPLLVHFFDTVPTGWDQAEYSWALSAGYLPHSPYILHYLAGRLFALAFEPARALSALSLVSGIASIALLIFVTRRLPRAWSHEAGNSPTALDGVPAAIVYGFSSLFVFQASTQEIYAMHAAVLLASIAMMLTSSRHRFALAGAMFGGAMGTHNGSVFVAPALVFLAWSLGKPNRLRTVVVWTIAAAAVYSLVVLWVVAVLPAGPEGRLVSVASYMRGLGAGWRLRALEDLPFLRDSLADLGQRLFGIRIAPLGLPNNGWVGLGPAHAAAVAAGIVALAARSPRVLAFWVLFSAPYLCYEVLLGWSVDPGVYVPLLFPALAVCAESALMTLAHWPRLDRRIGFGLALVGLGLLAAPSAARLSREWDVTPRLAGTLTRSVLAAAWVPGHLPANAVVVVPQTAVNPNLTPYYSRRRPILPIAERAMLLVEPRPYLPMNIRSYEVLTTERLGRLVADGIPVFAFDRDPLPREEDFDPSAFRWVPAGSADIEAAAAMLDLPEPVRATLPRHPVEVYRCEPTAPTVP